MGPLKLAATLALAMASSGALAQADAPPDRLQRGGTFVEPPPTVDRAYLPLGPDRPNLEAREPALVLRLTADFPLRNRARAGAGTQGSRPGAPTLQAALRWRPLQDPGWFVQGAVLAYPDRARQRPWDPDFTYSFGYDDGQLGHWAVHYANFTGTRWSPDARRGEGRWNFDQGQWTASYRFGLPTALQPWLLVGDGDAVTCHADAALVPRFTRQDGRLDSNKTSLALGCRYARPEGWFAHFTALAWPGSGAQQPWDPDYVYGFGWTRPGDPHALTVQYQNYSGNRWAGRPRGPGEGRFDSGSVSLSWSNGW